MNSITHRIQERLFLLQDIEYKAFQCRLMPTVSADAVIGVRTPELRKLAKEFSADAEISEFLSDLPHKYYEENNLHGAVICLMKDFDEAVEAVNALLPYVDNWATCDMMTPKSFKKHLPQLREEIKNWLKSDKIYTIRFGIGMLMAFYLDDEFLPEYLTWAAAVQSEEYYVNMMRAWYFATALAKQWDAVLPYIAEKRLDVWTHNKTIQKAVESNRITSEQKEYLKSLKIRQ